MSRATPREERANGKGEGQRDEEPSDAALVCEARSGDGEAFNALARRYRPMAVRKAATIVGKDCAEDVVQDALLLAFRSVRSMQDGSKFPAWLAAIIRFRALRTLRDEARFRKGLVPLDALPAEPATEVAARDDEEAGDEALLSALATVQPAYAEVLRLRFFHDFSHRKIADVLRAPVATVRWRCFRGKELLLDLLRPGP